MSDAPRLTVQQERDLVIATEAGDPDACRLLVEAFLPEIKGLARTFRHSVGLERLDLVQEGVAGLLFAARRYDPALDTPFWAYARFWVRKAMQELVADITRPVALSDRAVRGLAAIRAARRDHVARHEREPTTTELGRATGLSPEQVEQLLTTERTPRSIDARLRADDDTAGTVGDRIADPAAERAFDVVLDELEIREVHALTDELSDRERTVLLAHYGIGQPPRTLRQIGGSLGLSAERARQIEAGALGKLQTVLAGPALPRALT